MTNYELWGNPQKAREMFDKREKLLPQNSEYHCKFEDWIYKRADTALQVNPGDILQQNISDLNVPRFEYVLVDKLECNDHGIFNYIVVKMAHLDYLVREDVDGKVLDRLGIPDHNNFKFADIPDDFIQLAKCPNLDRCPLKDEGVCMKGGENE